MSTGLTYLITGANRGIGKAMAASLARQEGSIVVATMRKVNAEITSFYNEIKSTVSGRVVLTELDLLEPEAGFAKLGRTLSDVGITHLDVVIANAGASAGFTPTLETTGEDLLFDFKINTVATLGLFQLTWPLLEKSSSENPRSKKFVYITSSVGSIASLEEENFPGVSYGVSKAGANWMLKKIAVEYKEKGLKVGIIHPGWVKTGMGQKLADTVGFPEPPMTIDDSSNQVLEQIEKLSFETTSGKFIVYSGQELPW